MRGVKKEWKDEYVDIANKAAKEGSTINAIAAKLGVKKSKLYQWMLEHRKLATAIHEGRDHFDTFVVESKLLKLVKGSTSKSKHVTEKTDAIGNVIETTTKIVTEKILPDFRAVKWWLANRHQERWRDKYEVEFRGGETLEEKLRAARKRFDQEHGVDNDEEPNKDTQHEEWE